MFRAHWRFALHFISRNAICSRKSPTWETIDNLPPIQSNLTKPILSRVTLSKKQADDWSKEKSTGESGLLHQGAVWRFTGSTDNLLSNFQTGVRIKPATQTHQFLMPPHQHGLMKQLLWNLFWILSFNFRSIVCSLTEIITQKWNQNKQTLPVLNVLIVHWERRFWRKKNCKQ